ncbi:MAG: DNA-processing protein DprA [Sulfuricellaceae bacterium]|nr:DNA-processing protein DprA [Sulfuricellaceae bacterium]
MGTEEHLLWVSLSLIRGLGGESFRKLLQTFGEPDRIFSASHSALARVVRTPVATAISSGPDLQITKPTQTWLAQSGNHLITLADPDYPQGLLEMPDPPPMFYLKGRRDLLNQPAIAIVGSRNATPQGEVNAENFASYLSHRGMCIISGLALGIDGAAHRGALQGSGSSIAVVGTGLDIVYPSRHRDLAHELAQSGALISEFPIGTPSRAQNFPRRNRIISGLALGCLVVEAALKSGSLITARLAAEQGRDVFAIPGSIHSPLSKGCHMLIKQGAKLVESAQDILEEFGTPDSSPVNDTISGELDLSPDEAQILQCIGFDPVSTDVLASRSGLTSDRLSAILLIMELAGQVASLPGGMVQRISP